MESTPLDEFGRILMTRVRDKAILHWKMIASGKMTGEQAEHDLLDRLDADGRQTFLALVPAVVDTVLHHLLWTVEQNEKVQLVMVAPDGSVTNLHGVSDGLAGELYSKRGWIARFSEDAPARDPGDWPLGGPR